MGEKGQLSIIKELLLKCRRNEANTKLLLSKYQINHYCRQTPPMNEKIIEQSLKIGYLHSCNASPQGRFNYGRNNSDLTAEKPSRQLQSIVKVNITYKRYVKIT